MFLHYKFIKLLQIIRGLILRFLSTAKFVGAPIFIQPALLVGKGSITFARNVVIGYYPSPYFLSTYAHIEPRRDGSSISIGSGTKINNNFCAISECSSIDIGEDCIIGVNALILDSDFHALTFESISMRTADSCRPVKIGDRVFIGANVTILKGVTIGTGAVIGLGSVVTKDVEPYTLVAGNPAKFIRKLEI